MSGQRSRVAELERKAEEQMPKGMAALIVYSTSWASVILPNGETRDFPSLELAEQYVQRYGLGIIRIPDNGRSEHEHKDTAHGAGA